MALSRIYTDEIDKRSIKKKETKVFSLPKISKTENYDLIKQWRDNKWKLK